jgi:hypothetical protein
MPVENSPFESAAKTKTKKKDKNPLCARVE